jgi:hypothetical protein
MEKKRVSTKRRIMMQPSMRTFCIKLCLQSKRRCPDFAPL